MIQSITVTNPDATPVKWWGKIKDLQGRDHFEFDSGLTILWGPNGVGKSSILRALARFGHCEQGGVSKITLDSIHHFRGGKTLEPVANDGMTIVCDGQPMFYFDASATVGIRGNAFDDAFFMEGVMSMMQKRLSSGQQTNANVGGILRKALEDFEVDLSPLEALKKRSEDLYQAASRGFLGSIEKGRKTLLLDEPERSLDIPSQAHAWDLFAHQNKFQIIVSTHCPFALWIEGAMYIDLRPGYLDTCRKKFRELMEKAPPSDP